MLTLALQFFNVVVTLGLAEVRRRVVDCSLLQAFSLLEILADVHGRVQRAVETEIARAVVILSQLSARKVIVLLHVLKSLRCSHFTNDTLLLFFIILN